VGADIGNEFNAIGLMDKREMSWKNIRRYTTAVEDLMSSTGKILRRWGKKG